MQLKKSRKAQKSIAKNLIILALVIAGLIILIIIIRQVLSRTLT